MSTTSSRNFTTLYSGAGSVVPQGAYGNANVVSLLNEGTDGGNTIGNISATGNVTAAYFIGNVNAGNIVGNIAAAGSNTQVQFNNAGVLGADSDFTFDSATSALVVTGNITGNIINAATFTNPAATGNLFITNQSNVSGNSNLFITTTQSNSQIRLEPGTGANGKVVIGGNTNTPADVTLQGAYRKRLIITTNENYGGVLINPSIYLDDPKISPTRPSIEINPTNDGAAVVTGNLFVQRQTAGGGGLILTEQLSVVGNVGAGQPGNLVALGNITGANILTGGIVSAVGNITGANILTGGTISAAGNITANASSFFIGNGSQLTGIVATSTYGNANVANFLGNGFGSNTITTTGNITAGNVLVPINGRYYGDFTTGTASGRTMFQTTNTGTSAATTLTAIPGPNHTVSNTAFSSQMQLFANSADIGNSAFGRMQVFGNRLEFNTSAAGTGVAGNMRFSAGAGQMVFLTTGNVGIGNANPQHTFSTNEAYFQGNVSVTGNVIGSNVNTTGEVTATGNINGANLVASANLTSTQQTVVGTANNGSTGNIVMSGKNIATDMAWLPDGGNAATAVNGRIVVGTGWNGNISHSAVQNRLLVQDAVVRSNTTTNTQFFASDPIVSLTGNVTNNSFRVQGVASRVRIGGGSAGNTISGAFGVGSVGTVAALQPNIDVGNISPYNLGNTTVSQATLNGGFILAATGSTVNNAYGMIPGLNAGGGNITNYIGFASQLNGMSSGSVTGNVYGVYHGSNATINTTGIGTNNIVRSAPGYYAFYNADDVAQVKLGSLRSYNEFEFAANTSGTVNIDKNNAQVQYISPTGNVTIGDFQNFVSVANDGTNNDLQTDTVTLIIQQGATPYTVTMPTGNASIKYLGNVTTIGITANSVTMVNITAIKSLGNALGSTLYLTNITLEFV